MIRVDLREQPAGLNIFGRTTTLERPRRTAVQLFSLAAIASVALTPACYLLFSYGRPIGTDSKVIAAADRGMMVDLRASQQQTANELDRITQDAAATKADFQKLSDQVSALAAKVDALQDAASPTASIARQPTTRAQASTKKSSKPTSN